MSNTTQYLNKITNQNKEFYTVDEVIDLVIALNAENVRLKDKIKTLTAVNRAYGKSIKELKDMFKKD